MKTEKFKQLWEQALKIEEPKNIVGSDLMGLGGMVNYGLQVWAKNPVKGTVIVPVMFIGLVGKLSSMLAIQVYKNITDPQRAKENLKTFNKFESLYDNAPLSIKDEMRERMKDMDSYNAQVNITTFYNLSLTPNRYLNNSILNELGTNADYLRFYNKHLNEYAFSKKICAEVQKRYNKKSFNNGLATNLLDCVKNNDIEKFNFIFISLHFASNSYLDDIRQKSLETAMITNNLAFVKNLLDNPVLKEFSKVKNGLFEYDWGKLNTIIQNAHTDKLINEDIVNFISPLIEKNNSFTLFPKFKM